MFSLFSIKSFLYLKIMNNKKLLLVVVCCVSTFHQLHLSRTHTNTQRDTHFACGLRCVPNRHIWVSLFTRCLVAKLNFECRYRKCVCVCVRMHARACKCVCLCVSARGQWKLTAHWPLWPTTGLGSSYLIHPSSYFSMLSLVDESGDDIQF